MRLRFFPCKGIQDSLGFLIPRRGFRIPSTGFQSLSVEFGIPIVSRIPDSTRKSFPDDPEPGIRIPYIWQFVVQFSTSLDNKQGQMTNVLPGSVNIKFSFLYSNLIDNFIIYETSSTIYDLGKIYVIYNVLIIQSPRRKKYVYKLLVGYD